MKKSRVDVLLDGILEIAEGPHGTRCPRCNYLAEMAVFAGNERYCSETLELMQAHKSTVGAPKDAHSCDSERPCIFHEKLDAALARRMHKLATHKDRIEGNMRGWETFVAFDATPEDHPEGHVRVPCRHNHSKYDVAFPCNEAGAIYIKSGVRTATVHVTPEFPLDALPELLSGKTRGRKLIEVGGHSVKAPSPQEFAAYLDCNIQAHSKWALAKYHELKALAQMDLEINPSGRRYRMRKAK